MESSTRKNSNPSENGGTQLLNSRHLTRIHESMPDMCVQTKLQFLAGMDQVFSEYIGVFGDRFFFLNSAKPFIASP
ncbi:hypothetical protein GCM10010916_37190 [Paenibacillus abyssi]|uniref:Uncharacterized protein n=1 Tax=Paenibacillus abyssi TaxID=1340531 RepID=A0A917G0N4_9BACL|nr:hypothetical protein GCM10010916_37190 [Paenibacillus abyssi]